MTRSVIECFEFVNEEEEGSSDERGENRRTKGTSVFLLLDIISLFFLPFLSFDHLYLLLPIVFFRFRDQSSAFQYGSSTINYWQLPGFSESRDDDVRRR